jgi:hypothetical protein
LNFSKSGLKCGIDSCIDSVMDAGSKGDRSSIHLCMHGIRDAHGRHSGSKCAVGLIEDLVRQVWWIKNQIWRHLLRGRGIKPNTPAPDIPRPGKELDPGDSVTRKLGPFVDIVDVRNELRNVVGAQVREPSIGLLKALLHFLLKLKEV